MSGTNLSLTTKYRPRDFEEVVGQAAVVKSLQKSLKAKTSRAFLFVGPSGCGKTTLARIVCSHVGCPEENLMEIDAATHTGIDQMRQLIDLAQFAPVGGELTRCIIVDEAHALSSAAWKSLLKSIEEPPEGLYWMLCTTNPEKVPPTIKTRCTTFALKAVSRADLQELVEAVVDVEDLSMPEEVIRLIVHEAAGSPRQALANLAACVGCKTAEEAADILETVTHGDADIADLCKALMQNAPSWEDILPIVNALKGKDAESIRLGVTAYLGAILSKTQAPSKAARLLGLLSAFSSPWYHDKSMQTSLLLAVGQIVFDSGD